jgi:hypothetical protein
MFVNVFVDLIVERAFFEIKVRVNHRSVDVNDVSCVLFFVKKVASAVQLLLQK